MKCEICKKPYSIIYDQNPFNTVMCKDCYLKEIKKGNIVKEVKNKDGSMSYKAINK